LAVQETIVLNVKTKGLEAVEKRIARIQQGTNKLGKQQAVNRALTTEQLIVRKIAEIEGIITRETNKQVTSQRKVNAGKKKELSLTNRIAKAARSKRLAAATIGGAFPILFGGGPGSSIGGALGGFAGGPGVGGFAGSLAGSIIGGIIDKTVAEAAKLGAALNPLTVDIAALTISLGESQSEFGQLLLQLEELGDKERALEEATARLTQIVGEDGVEALKNFDDEVVIFWDECNKATTSVAALAATIGGPLLGAINEVLNRVNAVNAYETRKRNDPAFAAKEEALIENRFAKIRADTLKHAQSSLGTPLTSFGSEGGIDAIKFDVREYFMGTVHGDQQAIRALELAKEQNKVNLNGNKILQDRIKELKILRDAQKDGSSAPVEKADRTAQQMADLQYNRAMLALKQQYVPLVGEEGRLYEKQLREKQITLQLDKDIAKIHAGTSKNKAEEILNKQLVAKGKLQDLDNKEALLMAVRQENYEKLIERLDLELRIKEAVTEEQRKQLEIEKKMLALKGEFDEDQQEKIKEKLKALDETDKGGKLKKYMEGLQESLKDVDGMIVSLLETIESEFASAMSSAIYGVITGTKTAQEAFSEMFANIGKAFIDMATQMIAKALILKALGVVLGGAAGGGGGGEGYSGGGFAGGLSKEWAKYMAEGDYVTGPTNAIVGEGGQPEYVIPESKMDGALSRWNEGARGDDVLSDSPSAGGESGGSSGGALDVNYNVTQINGMNFVTEEQFQAGMNKAAKQGSQMGSAMTLGRLRNSPTTRRKVGI